MTTPTQAQIDAAFVAFIDAKGVFPGNRKAAIEAALTAAAQVGNDICPDCKGERRFPGGALCKTCNGLGTVAAQVGKCKTCGGMGYLVGDAEYEPYAVQCPECKAAAQGREQDLSDGAFTEWAWRDRNATIERCAQVAEKFLRAGLTEDIPSEIRKLKDVP